MHILCTLWKTANTRELVEKIMEILYCVFSGMCRNKSLLMREHLWSVSFICISNEQEQQDSNHDYQTRGGLWWCMCFGSGSDAQLCVCLWALAETRVALSQRQTVISQSSSENHWNIQVVFELHISIVMIFWRGKPVIIDKLYDWRYCNWGLRWRKTMQGTRGETPETWVYRGVNHSQYRGKEWWCNREERAIKGRKGKKGKACVRETECRHLQRTVLHVTNTYT